MLHIPIVHTHGISKEIPLEKKIFHWVENVIIYALIDRKVLSLQFRFTGVARP